MGDTTTPNIGLIKPQVGGSRSTWGNKWNTNADDIDSHYGSQQSAIATLQSQVATLQGQVAALGAVGAPIGAIFPWPNFGAYPGGYLLCSGGTVAVASYPALFNVIGYVYGGGGANFGLPDFRGCVLTGYDGGTGRLGGLVADSPGAVGGAPYIAISEAQMPSHQHGGSTSYQGEHGHGYTSYTLPGGPGFQIGSGAQFLAVTAQTGLDGTHRHDFATDWHGGGQGHANLQVSAVIAWIIRAI